MEDTTDKQQIRKLLRLERSSLIFSFEGQASEKTEWKLPDGRLHREFGPAVEWKHGDKEWWLNGFRHRDDAPAIIYKDGYQAWFNHGVCLKEIGPIRNHSFLGEDNRDDE